MNRWIPTLSPYFLFFTFIMLTNVAQARQWSVIKGTNAADLSEQGIHIYQTAPNDTINYAWASANMNINSSQKWRISFELRFGQLGSAGTSVRLCRGEKVIGIVGADGVYQKMGAFIGTDQEDFIQPTDNKWHKFDFLCDGNVISIFHNGLKVSEEVSPGTPDNIRVGSWWDGKNPAGKQTEIWLRNVQEQSTINSTQPIIPEIIQASANITMTSLDNLVEDYNDILIRAQEANRNLKNALATSQGYADLAMKSRTDAEVAEFLKHSDSCMKQEEEYMALQKQYLRKGITLYHFIQSNPNYHQRFHETKVCLSPEDVTLDMPEAESLRFIEKR